MPHIPKKEPHDAMGRLLRGYQLGSPQLARVLGCSAPTARSKLNNPGRLTLDDIMKINKSGHIPIEEIRDAIGK